MLFDNFVNLKTINIIYACFKRLKIGTQKFSFNNPILQSLPWD